MQNICNLYINQKQKQDYDNYKMPGKGYLAL